MITIAACLEAMDRAYDPSRPPPEGWTVLGSTDAGPVRASLAERDGVAVLFVQGSVKPIDWLSPGEPRPLGLLDLDSVPVSCGDRKVHAGALLHAQALGAWRAWESRARLIVGHSLGAASGLLVAWTAGLPCLAIAPFRPFFGAAPPVDALSLVDPSDAVPSFPPGDWHLPGSVWILPASGEAPPEAHHPASYLRHVGALGGLDLAPWLAGTAAAPHPVPEGAAT